MNKIKTPKNPWTKGEKFILGAILLTVMLATLGTFWWKQINTTPVVSVPTPTMPAQNAFGVFLDAASAENGPVDNAMSSIPIPPGPGQLPHIYSPAEKAALVKANAAALTLLHQGLALPYQNPPVRSFIARMPYYARFRRLARLTALVGQVREAQGNWGGATQSSLDAVQLGEKIPKGGPLIGELVGIACQSIGRRPLWNEAQHLNAAQSRQDAQRMERIMASRVPFAETLQEEEWCNQAALLETFRQPNWRSELREIVQINAYDSGWTQTAGQMAQMLVISKRAILNDYTFRMDQLRQDARGPYAARPALPPSDMATESLTDFWSTAWFRDVDSDAENALLLVTLALRAYRLEHGAYPATLAALTPVYLRLIPTDPFAASGPLHYKGQGNKYVLYSIGPDGKDDGGKPIFDNTKPVPQPGKYDQRYYVSPGSQGDIVAGVNP